MSTKQIGIHLWRSRIFSRHSLMVEFCFRSARGFMHMKIQRVGGGRYVLGQFSKPFATIPEMVNHYIANRLPIKGAEHMCLQQPVCEQLL